MLLSALVREASYGVVATEILTTSPSANSKRWHSSRDETSLPLPWDSGNTEEEGAEEIQEL